MMKSVMSLLIASVITPSWAQPAAPSVGSIQSVDGLVTISQGTTLGNAAAGTALTNGAIVVSTSGASTFIQLSNGCSVPLSANQAVTIDTSLSCDQLSNSVRTVASGPASGGGGLGGGGFAVGASAGFLGLPFAVFAVDQKLQPSQSLSGK